MQSAVTTQFTYNDYLDLKGIEDFLIQELCFPDEEEPTEDRFEEFKKKYFIKLVKLDAKYLGNKESTIYLSLVYGYCYFVIIGKNGKYLMDNDPSYKYIAEYFRAIDKLDTVSKIKHFIFKEGTHTIDTVNSLSLFIAIKNKSFKDVRKILLEKFAEKMDSDEYEMDVLKIGEFLATGTCGDYNDYSIFIKYRSEEELFYKIVYHLFDRLIIFLQEEYERTLTIEENMRKICFDRHFCLNKDVKIY